MIRRDKFACSRGEMLEGGAAVAAPIFDVADRPIATPGITMPSHRLTEGAIRKMGEKAVQAAAMITRAMRLQKPA